MSILAISSLPSPQVLLFIEMKFVADDDKKPLKVIVKESLFVYSASVVGIYLYSQFDTNSAKAGGGKATMAFVDNPTF